MTNEPSVPVSERCVWSYDPYTSILHCINCDFRIIKGLVPDRRCPKLEKASGSETTEHSESRRCPAKTERWQRKNDRGTWVCGKCGFQVWEPDTPPLYRCPSCSKPKPEPSNSEAKTELGKSDIEDVVSPLPQTPHIEPLGNDPLGSLPEAIKELYSVRSTLNVLIEAFNEHCATKGE